MMLHVTTLLSLTFLIAYCNTNACEVTPIKSPSGNWVGINADNKEIVLDLNTIHQSYKTKHIFNIYIDKLQFDTGTWESSVNNLILNGSADTNRYKFEIEGNILSITDSKVTQYFVRKEEWRELLIYGSCTASSTLNGEQWFGDDIPAYSVRNLGDGNPATCWAEGAKGPGIGERIYLMVNGKPKSLTIINGYGKSKSLFKKNGRVKVVEISLLAAFDLPGDVTEVATKYYMKRCGPTTGFVLKDIQAKQTVSLPFKWERIEEVGQALARAFEKDFSTEIEQRAQGNDVRYSRTLVLCLEIVQVYPGTKYEDTCISELYLE